MQSVQLGGSGSCPDGEGGGLAGVVQGTFRVMDMSENYLADGIERLW